MSNNQHSISNDKWKTLRGQEKFCYYCPRRGDAATKWRNNPEPRDRC